MSNRKKVISHDMTILDIVSENRETIDVFKKYDVHAGECICCTSLFETLENVTKKYGIDLNAILDDLCNA
jgi:hypothetical protein